jgi:hypothetical protein
VRQGAEVEFRLTVANPGDRTATNVGPSFLPYDPAALEVVSGPTPAGGVTLGSGGQQVFTWTIRAKRAGSLTLSASVTGDDATNARKVGRSASLAVTVNPPFDAPILAYPNPATGDSVRIGLVLDDDADEVVVDVYNPAMHRVYHGAWAAVKQLEAGVRIDGVKAWAPGVYFVRTTVTLKGGKKKTYDPFKMVVKR